MKEKETNQLIWLVNLLKDIIANNFYGELIIKFESGKMVQIRKNQSLKPPNVN